MPSFCFLKDFFKRQLLREVKGERVRCLPFAAMTLVATTTRVEPDLDMFLEVRNTCEKKLGKYRKVEGTSSNFPCA